MVFTDAFAFLSFFNSFPLKTPSFNSRTECDRKVLNFLLLFENSVIQTSFAQSFILVIFVLSVLWSVIYTS